MDYFKILHLQREPFSNSPEPEFFFQSDLHLTCLQKLELAIRLRRGLNVVIGDVGTGKTTLCRQLILKFARTEEDRNQIKTNLIMDPSFGSAQEFLKTVAQLLGVATSAKGQSEWQLKENIKKYLFKKGIDEGKIVVLIIDEGQKIPSFCLEILREFLNYETTEYKLLQIVIFAQREFEPLLQAHANFADRVNQYNFLPPLNFRDTKNMIKFRIARASANPASVPSLFSLPALWAIYRATEGYPRKIIALCHQAILAMIIQNRVKAGFFLVRSCAARVSFMEKANGKGPHWRLALTLASAVIGLLLLLLILPIGQGTSSLPWWKTVAARVGLVQKESLSPDGAEGRLRKPELLGQLVLKQNERVEKVLERIYGKDAHSQRASFAKANPQLRHSEEVKSGEAINIPARSRTKHSLPSGKYWVQILSLKDLRDAYEFITEVPETQRFTLLPYWNHREGLTFAVLLKEGFKDEAAAQAAKKALSPPFRALAHVVTGWGDDTVFL